MKLLPSLAAAAALLAVSLPAAHAVDATDPMTLDATYTIEHQGATREYRIVTDKMFIASGERRNTVVEIPEQTGIREFAKLLTETDERRFPLVRPADDPTAEPIPMSDQVRVEFFPGEYNEEALAPATPVEIRHKSFAPEFAILEYRGDSLLALAGALTLRTAKEIKNADPMLLMTPEKHGD